MRNVSCALTLRDKEKHPFKTLRSATIAEARSNPIAAEGNQSQTLVKPKEVNAVRI